MESLTLAVRALITFRIKYGISSQQFSFDIALFTPFYELSDNELLYRLSAEKEQQGTRQLILFIRLLLAEVGETGSTKRKTRIKGNRTGKE